ncbi:leucyl aminopeptidase [Agromyces sp. NPDC058136]|uniref:leucyl aminopeptidase n=1 Tax=Agromyces sp. NPDC058136 TaxID=3346354 RepID=UPI0036D88F9C
MTVPTLSVTTSPAPAADADVVLLVATKGADRAELLGADGFEWVGPQLVALGATGASDELTRLPGIEGGPRVVAVVGVGEQADASGLRRAAGSAVRRLTDTASVAIGSLVDDAAQAAALLEGAALGAYAYDEYRTEAKPSVSRIALHSTFDAEAIGLDRITSVVAAVARTKDLVNASPSELYPESFAALAVEAADAVGVTSRVWDEAGLVEDGFGGITGVGQGSSRGPRLVRLEWAPDGASTHLAFIGKGITFDSGGLSLKPATSMVGMKTDMAGAAAVLSSIVAIAELGLPVRITGWLCLAENMPSGTAIRPNDVLRIRGGKTVEVTNTDAEGRLVLADALVAASEEQPDAIIDVATLTGAQVVALGHRITGLMGDDELVARVRSAADAVDESTWPMPLPGDLLPLLKSDVADLMNTKLGMTVPGMLLAGVFLQQFVGKQGDSDRRIPWAHLDIAGPAHNSGSGWGFTGTGATGAAVRTLVALGEDFSTK